MVSLLAAVSAGIAAVLGAAAVFARRKRAQDDVYSALDHRALNLPLDGRGGEPQTEWMNMGWWTTAEGNGKGAEIQNGKTFPRACEDLARRLYASAGLRPSTDVDPKAPVVLDIGHGYGESLLLLARSYSPSRLDGITYSHREADRARSRATAAEVRMPVTIHCGDATEVLSQSSIQYDYIFALDCAYHFPSMAAFLSAAEEKLRPGGTLALFDLFVDDEYPLLSTDGWFEEDATISRPPSRRSRLSRYFNHVLLFLFSKSSPAIALMSFGQYHDLLLHTFGDKSQVHIQDVTSHVFPGFSAFLRRFSASPNGDTRMRFGMRLFSRLLLRWAQGGDGGLVRCGIVVIKKEKIDHQDTS